MTIYKSPAADIALSEQTITERVFAGISPDSAILIDGPTGRTMTGWSMPCWRRLSAILETDCMPPLSQPLARTARIVTIRTCPAPTIPPTSVPLMRIY